jgi:hypothetical protein
MTAFFQTAASGWTPDARGRRSRGDIGMVKCALVVRYGQSVFFSQSVTSLGLE